MTTSMIKMAGLALMGAAALPAPAAPARTDWRPHGAEKIAIRVQIEALAAEYYYRIDHGDAVGVVELFTPDGLLKIGDSEALVGREAIRAYYTARSRTRITRHVTTNLRLHYIDADHVEGVRDITYFHAEPTAGPPPYPAIPVVAEYREMFERGGDGRWRYASRIARPVFSAHP